MALPNAKVMIHQLSGGFSGQSSDIEIHAREALTMRKRLDEIIAKHTGPAHREGQRRHRARLLPERRGGRASTASSTGDRVALSGAGGWVSAPVSRVDRRPRAVQRSSHGMSRHRVRFGPEAYVPTCTSDRTVDRMHRRQTQVSAAPNVPAPVARDRTWTSHRACARWADAPAGMGRAARPRSAIPSSRPRAGERVGPAAAAGWQGHDRAAVRRPSARADGPRGGDASGCGDRGRSTRLIPGGAVRISTDRDIPGSPPRSRRGG